MSVNTNKEGEEELKAGASSTQTALERDEEATEVQGCGPVCAEIPLENTFLLLLLLYTWNLKRDSSLETRTEVSETSCFILGHFEGTELLPPTS